ncbi:MAG: hypothetical protein BIFFINMI_00394 [Phycisphaerae bacterium]|nr:hypothetical protein [Phycisphaerae bacterium]
MGWDSIEAVVRADLEARGEGLPSRRSRGGTPPRSSIGRDSIWGVGALATSHIRPGQATAARAGLHSGTVTWYRGGSYLSLQGSVHVAADDSPRGVHVSPHGSVPVRRGGGLRGDVTTFSAESRNRMIRRLVSVDRGGVAPGSVLFVTLTYPAAFEGDPAAWKADLAAWRRRLERRHGKRAVFWKLEPQERQAPHFHLLVFGLDFSDTVGGCWEFGQWVASSWHDLVGRGDDDHLRHGSDVQPVESWEGVMSYAAKYLGKEVPGFVDVDTGELKASGRWWGVWRGELLPRVQVVARVEPVALVRVRRAARKLVERQRGKRASWLRGRVVGRSFVIVPEAVVAALVDYYAPGAVARSADLIGASRRSAAKPMGRVKRAGSSSMGDCSGCDSKRRGSPSETSLWSSDVRGACRVW